MKKSLHLIIFLPLLGFSQTNNLTEINITYLGQTPPENRSEVFAPDLISTKLGELNSVITHDGKEFYFSRRGVPGKQSTIMFSRMVNDSLTTPVPVFTNIYSDIDLFITHDGSSMIFCSNRSHNRGDKMKMDHDFWISERNENRWSEPVLFAKEAISEHEDYFPIITNSRNLYFNSQRESPGTNNIFLSRFIDGKYTKAEKLSKPINSEYREFDAYVSPDEKMIIFSSDRPGGFGGADIYLSFKKPDKSWTKPLNLGNDINSSASEYGSTVSPDGKYFFYTSSKKGNEDIYWVSTKIIRDIRPKF